MSLMNNRKSLIAATIAAIFVLALFGTITFKNENKKTETKQSTPQYQYVSAKNAIKKNAVIKEEDVEIKMSPASLVGSYKATGEVVGRKAKQDIEVGKPIMKVFVQEIKIDDGASVGIKPTEGFRAIPILVRKSSLPPYISLSDRFDLATKENSMTIENLRILNMLDPTKDDSNKMLILEIKSEDIPSFIKYQVATKGFIFLQKNKEDIGEYKFMDIHKLEEERKKAEEKKLFDELLKQANEPASLPPIENIKNNEPIPDFQPSGFIETKNTKEVEVIIGNSKTKMEFED